MTLGLVAPHRTSSCISPGLGGVTLNELTGFFYLGANPLSVVLWP